MADGDHAMYATAPGIRKRARRIEYRGGSRFITFSCYRRLPLLSNPAIADAFLNEVQQTRTEHGFRLFGGWHRFSDGVTERAANMNRATCHVGITRPQCRASDGTESE